MEIERKEKGGGGRDLIKQDNKRENKGEKEEGGRWRGDRG